MVGVFFISRTFRFFSCVEVECFRAVVPPVVPCARDRPQLDKYAPCVSLIDDVFRLKWRGLLVAGYASAVMLAWFGSLMYLVERDDNEVQVCYLKRLAFVFRDTRVVSV